MKLIKKDKEKIVVAVEVNESLANAIRRSVYEIPVLAIDEVEFHKNDSVLYDEVLAHRLALIPLLNVKVMKLREECSCKGKGCSACGLDLKLVAKGPCTVFAKDLKGKAKPAYPDMPIVELAEGQEIELVARARLGKGIEHAKFSPGFLYYRNVPEIEIKDCDITKCEECAVVCPNDVLKVEKNKITVSDKYACDMCELCVETCRKKGENPISIKSGNEILFFIESWGQIDAKDVFIKAADALKKNLKAVK